MTIVDNYASGQLSVSGSGVSSSPTSFNLSGPGSASFSVAGRTGDTATVWARRSARQRTASR